MRFNDMPNCCSAQVLVGLEPNRWNGMSDDENAESEEYIRNSVLSALFMPGELYKKTGRVKRIERDAAIIATINDQQQYAKKALEDLGFQHSKWMSKEKHNESRLRIYWLHVDAAKERLRPMFEELKEEVEVFLKEAE